MSQQLIAVIAVSCVLCLVACGAVATTVTIHPDKGLVEMGRDVRVEALVKDDAGQPVAGVLLLPYVNQRRWGSHEQTDATGKATFLMPLPNPGPARVQVMMRAAQAEPKAQWLWAGPAKDGQTVYLSKTFNVDGIAKAATLYAAVDDQCTIFLNGVSVGDMAGWQKPLVVTDLPGKLKAGDNVLAVCAKNGTGPAGFVARLQLEDEKGAKVYETDASWKAWTDAPDGWPMPSGGGASGAGGASKAGEPATVLGRVDKMTWSGAMKGWPGLVDPDELFAGRLMPFTLPEGAMLSNAIGVEVMRRAIVPHKASDRLVGMQWEPWFTPLNAYWQTAQAVPVVGFYDSYNRDVLRQHILWFADLGIDFIMPDWSNHIWGKQHWTERPEGTNEIIHATGLLLEELADMKTEGIPVPKVVLMPGLTNGPAAAMTAVNEELQWVCDAWVKNPRFSGLWLDYDGKPLIVILDTAVAADKDPVHVDESQWTVRWISTQLQKSHHEKLGYWSWMDGSLEPVITYRDDKPEVITPTPAYFGDGGWLYPEARGRRGGTTYIESFKPALDAHPRVVLLHQWNEFTGQAEGQGYGDKHDIYVDTYSVELSDDLEPVSPTAAGYRGDKGGWGFYYLNLTQALLAMYRGETPDDTILTVSTPLKDLKEFGDTYPIEWVTLGKKPTDFTVMVDGTVLAQSVQGNTCEVNVKILTPGKHTVTVTANGAATHFPLSISGMDVPLAKPIPPRAEWTFFIEQGHK